MAKKQTRRSISVNRDLYERAKLAAAARGTSLSKLTERAVELAIATTVSAPGAQAPSPAAKVEAVLARIMPGANRINPRAWEKLVAELMLAAQPAVEEIFDAAPQVYANNLGKLAEPKAKAQADGDAMIKGLTRHG
jgi:hypothetical protein